MINLKVKRKTFYYDLIRWLITVFFALPVVIYGLYVGFLALINHQTDIGFNLQILLYCSIPALFVNFFFLIFGLFYKNYLNRLLIWEFYEIVTLNRVPNSPKVVYVYTCHNDMYEGRVLQNIKQTYKNFECWISEGSEKQEVIEKSRAFAEKHKIKFFAVGGNGSSNKADNLNAFLSRSGASFDYLLITDSDECLGNNFVECALKCFANPHFHNLGYVSPQNYCYNTDNLFSNVFLNSYCFDIKTGVGKNIDFGDMPNLYSSSCLISKDLLNLNGGLFPTGCLEDVYLEHFALCHGFSSVTIPMASSGQAFDASIKAFQKRNLRISDWGIKLLKEKKLSNYNEKYKKWWTTYLANLFTPFTFVLRWFIIAIFLWLLIYYNNFLFSTPFFLTIIIYSIVAIIISRIGKLFIISKIYAMGNNLWFVCCLLYFLFSASSRPYALKHWFDSMIRSKYSAFGGSGQKTKAKSKFQIIKWDLLGLLICAILFAGWISIFILLIGLDNHPLCLLLITVAILIGVFLLSFIGEIILFWMGLIPHNKTYSKDDFINPPKILSNPKIKEKFINAHKDDKKYDLSCLD